MSLLLLPVFPHSFQRHAATRYAVWYGALVALALLPLSGQVSFGGNASTIPSRVIHPTIVASHVTKKAANAGAVLSGNSKLRFEQSFHIGVHLRIDAS